MAFNKSQLKAIKIKKGPTLVLAGPGSGKTTVITEHSKFLLENNITQPQNLMVVTFTKNSANEMQMRFNELTNNKYMEVTFGTFHHIYFQIVRKANPTEDYTLLSKTDRDNYLNDIVNELGLEIKNKKEFYKKIATDISCIKGSMEDFDDFTPTACNFDDFMLIYRKYQKKLKDAKIIDYDDMLLMCYNILTTNDEVLKYWQEKYEYILVDEFQDTNKIQFEILKLLALPQNNLFVVGDDDQSIYKFRGAKPEIMLNFEKYYPKTKIITLDINYRCPSHVVNAANLVIENNKDRYAKNLIAHKKDGEKVIDRMFSNQYLEHQEIVNKIKENIALGVSPNEIAILYRTNNFVGNLTKTLIDNDIDFYIQDGLGNLYEKWVVEDIMAYVYLSLGKPEELYLRKIIHKPSRYVTNVVLNKIPSITIENLIDYYDNVTGQDYVLEHLIALKHHLNELSKIEKPKEKIEYICNNINYIEYVKTYCADHALDIDETMLIIEELLGQTEQFNTCHEWFEYIIEYTNKINDKKNNNTRTTNAINLLTMHSAKGLEYDVVFIVDANETIIPSSKAMKDNDIEEERRLFYVAMTRTKQRLYIYSLKNLGGKTIDRSRFVNEYIKGLKKQELKNENDKIVKEIQNAQKTIDRLTLEEKDEVYELINDVPKPLENINLGNDIKVDKQVYHPAFEHGFIQSEDDNRYYVYFVKKNKIIVLNKKVCDMLSILHFFKN